MPRKKKEPICSTHPLYKGKRWVNGSCKTCSAAYEKNQAEIKAKRDAEPPKKQVFVCIRKKSDGTWASSAWGWSKDKALPMSPKQYAFRQIMRNAQNATASPSSYGGYPKIEDLEVVEFRPVSVVEFSEAIKADYTEKLQQPTLKILTIKT